MRIKKKIFAMLMMLCMVLQMLPNTVLAETISGEGNTYIGPTRICPNRELKFSFKTDNVGPDGRDAWIGGIDKIDETYLSVYIDILPRLKPGDSLDSCSVIQPYRLKYSHSIQDLC